jgi:phage gp36-like protein
MENAMSIQVEKLVLALGTELLAALADDNRDGLYDQGVLEEALATAEETVREELRRGGYTPPADLPLYYQDLAVRIAAESLLRRRRSPVPDAWRDSAESARRILSDIGSGRRNATGMTRSRRIDATPQDEPTHTQDNLRGL